MPIELTILGGYLGAGKTTLINRLLAAPKGRKLTILVNDFGAINIDAGLIAAHDGDTLTLTNGCACCQLRDDMIDQLTQLSQQQNPPDHIIVEASGAGEPARLAYLGYGIDGLRLDAVFVAVDATDFAKRRNDKFVGKLVTRQITQADLIFLTKVELTADHGGQAMADLHALTKAPIIATHGSDIAASFFDAAPLPDKEMPETTHGLDAKHLFDQLSFTAPTALPINPLDALLTSYIGKLARAKGHTGTHRLQWVGEKYVLVEAEAACPVLVFIAPKGLCDMKKLEADLKALTPSGDGVMVGPAGLEPATNPL
jgi:G3E family GTPase